MGWRQALQSLYARATRSSGNAPPVPSKTRRSRRKQALVQLSEPNKGHSMLVRSSIYRADSDDEGSTDGCDDGESCGPPQCHLPSVDTEQQHLLPHVPPHESSCAYAHDSWHVQPASMLAAWACAALLLSLAGAVALAGGWTAWRVRHSHLPAPQRTYAGSATLSDQCTVTSPRTYCGPIEVDKGGCEARGCCWSPQPAADRNSDTSSCFWPVQSSQYTIVSKRTTALGFELSLQLRQAVYPHLGPDLPRLTVLMEAHTDSRLHLRVEPVVSDVEGAEPRWDVPEDLLPRPRAPAAPPEAPLFEVQVPEVGQDFWVKVCRTAEDRRCVFSTEGWGLTFKQQYMQLTTALTPGSALLGLGETVLPTGLVFPRNGKMVTLWNYDTAVAYSPGRNLYGSHAFWLEVPTPSSMEVPPAAHGVFLLNSNAMDIELWQDHLTYRVTGGVLDLHVFLGPEPEAVIKQYHEVIGKPALPPLWALGWHQSKWGYGSWQVLYQVVNNYQKAGIPLDVIWSDIDYLQNYRIFTIDPATFPLPEFSNFVKWLNANGMHWVPILDPALQANPDWATYTDGLAKGIYLGNSTGMAPFLGQVWAGVSAFPDFFNPATVEFWQAHVQQLLAAVPASGIWIDMNEPSNFCTGDCTAPPGYWTRLWRAMWWPASMCKLNCLPSGLPGDSISNPPYAVNSQGSMVPLGCHTVSMDARHANGYIQYNTHNLYSLSEARATYDALVNATGKRPFILTRSSFPSMGRFAAHWTGDNAATWEDLRASVQGLLNSNMWGMPMAGSDICGFMGNSNEELCARWIEAGAFYTFARNHGEKNSQPQEAYIWPMTRTAAISALGLRHRLLPHMYTLLHQASQLGGTVARPLLFGWPGIAAALAASEDQWLLGSQVMVAAVVQQGQQGRQVFFPPGPWVRLGPDGNVTDSVTGPVSQYVEAPIGRPSVWVRGGAIVPLAAHTGPTVAQTAAAPLVLLVVLNGSCSALTEAAAAGHLYADDGVSLLGAGASSLELSFSAVCGAACGTGSAVNSSCGSLRVVHKAVQAHQAAAGYRGSSSAVWHAGHVLLSGMVVLDLGSSRHDEVSKQSRVTVGVQVREANMLAEAGIDKQLCVGVRETGVTGVRAAGGHVRVQWMRPVPLLCVAGVYWA